MKAVMEDEVAVRVFVVVVPFVPMRVFLGSGWQCSCFVCIHATGCFERALKE